MAQWYRNAPAKFMNKEIDWDSDDIRVTLHTSTYTPNLDTDAYVGALTNELATGSGYTVNGIALASKTITYTAANSFSTQWAASTVYEVGKIVRPTTGNGKLYVCSVAGTSSGTQPSWPTTVGQTVTDNTVTWTCAGSGVVTIDGADPIWTTASFTARYAAISNRTPGTAATQPLIALIDFLSNQTGQGGNFEINFDSQGILHAFVP